jgi:hypothetical protein
MDGYKHKLEALSQGTPTEREYERAFPMRGDPAARGPDWPSREGATERTWPLRETSLEGMPTALEVRGTCQPKDKPLQ